MFNADSILFAVLAGIAGAIAWIAYFRAFSVGDVSVVVPIASSWGVIPFILALAFLSEKLTLNQSAFSVLIFAGVFLVSVKWKEFAQSFGKRFKEGAALALLAMIGFGLVGFFLKFAVDALGIFYSLVVYRAITVAILLPMGSRTKKERVNGVPLLVLIGVLEALAGISYNWGLSAGLVSLVSAVISTETIIAVVLAFVFLRERLTQAQAIGIAAVVAGLIGLSLFG